MKTGRQLYRLNRDELRDMCGFGEGTRLYSHLQRDKAKVLCIYCSHSIIVILILPHRLNKMLEQGMYQNFK